MSFDFLIFFYEHSFLSKGFTHNDLPSGLCLYFTSYFILVYDDRINERITS